MSINERNQVEKQTHINRGNTSLLQRETIPSPFLNWNEYTVNITKGLDKRKTRQKKKKEEKEKTQKTNNNRKIVARRNKEISEKDLRR